MKYICDAPQGRTWFRIETDAEAAKESADMQHAVEKHYLREKDQATQSFKPASTVNFEQLIGLRAHLDKTMPVFLTLRDRDGAGHATAMLPPGGKDVGGTNGGGTNGGGTRIIIVGRGNADPYPQHDDAIQILGRHFGLSLERGRCFPYSRG